MFDNYSIMISIININWDEGYTYIINISITIITITITMMTMVMMILITMIAEFSFSICKKVKVIINNITINITISNSETIVRITTVRNSYGITIVDISNSVDIKVKSIIVIVDKLSIVIANIMIKVIVVPSIKAIFETCMSKSHC